MQKNNTNIENLFQNSFKEYKETPSVETWKNINSKLNFEQFFRFAPMRPNIFYAAGILLLAIILVVIINNKNNNPDVYINKVSQNLLSEQNIHVREVTKNNVVTEQNTETIVEITNFNSNNEIIVETTNYIKVISDTTAEKYVEISNDEKIDNKTDVILEKLIVVTKLQNKIELSETQGCCPLIVQFSCSTKDYNTIEWDFDNGNVSRTNKSEIKYDEPGTYIIGVTFTKDKLVQTLYDTIKVYENPISDFETENIEFVAKVPINFMNNCSEASNTYQWIFGDGTTSDQKTTMHAYENFGNYEVKLITKTPKNCIDTSTHEIFVRTSRNRLEFPTAFVADVNGSNGGYYSDAKTTNNVFYPVIQSPVQDYHLTIFNKNGILIFESKDIKIGWDGYYKNELVEIGVYIYNVKGRFEQGEYFNKRGDITVLHGE